jgi:acyl carrier protein
MWQKLLHRAPSPDSNFFMDGGHSLLAVRFVMMIRQNFGLTVDARAIFEQPVFGDLADMLEQIDTETLRADWEEL